MDFYARLGMTFIFSGLFFLFATMFTDSWSYHKVGIRKHIHDLFQCCTATCLCAGVATFILLIWS